MKSLAVLALFALVGCGTAGQQFAGTLVGADPPAHPQSGSNIVIKQQGNPGFAWRSCLIDVFVNGQFVTKMRAGERTSFNVRPGQQVVEVVSSRDAHNLYVPDTTQPSGYDRVRARCAQWSASRQTFAYSRINLYIEPF